MKEAYPDHTAWDPESKYFDPRSTPEKPQWFMPDVQFVEKFPRMVSLPSCERRLASKRWCCCNAAARLSVQPVRDEEWEIILGIARDPAPVR